MDRAKLVSYRSIRKLNKSHAYFKKETSSSNYFWIEQRKQLDLEEPLWPKSEENVENWKYRDGEKVIFTKAYVL